VIRNKKPRRHDSLWLAGSFGLGAGARGGWLDEHLHMQLVCQVTVRWLETVAKEPVAMAAYELALSCFLLLLSYDVSAA
jgi:hypothetical protein